MTQTEALKLALEALEVSRNTLNASRNWLQHRHDVTHDLAITAIKEALAQPEHEFVLGECVKCGASIERQEPVATSDTSKERVDETAKQRHEQEPIAFPDAPQTIYLQVGNECPDDAHWGELVDVCWCDEQVFDNDIVYVRADTIPSQRYEQEPVAKVIDWGIEGPRLKGLTEDWPRVGTLLYACPPQEQQSCDKRKPLTDEELYKVFPAIATYHEANKTLYRSIARAIEAAHGIKGEA